MESSLCPEFKKFLLIPVFLCVRINKKIVLKVFLAIDKYIHVNSNILENGSC